MRRTARAHRADQVRVHDAFRQAGGAAGIDQGYEIVRLRHRGRLDVARGGNERGEARRIARPASIRTTTGASARRSRTRDRVAANARSTARRGRASASSETSPSSSSSGDSGTAAAPSLHRPSTSPALDGVRQDGRDAFATHHAERGECIGQRFTNRSNSRWESRLSPNATAGCPPRRAWRLRMRPSTRLLVAIGVSMGFGLRSRLNVGSACSVTRPMARALREATRDRRVAHARQRGVQAIPGHAVNIPAIQDCFLETSLPAASATRA